MKPQHILGQYVVQRVPSEKLLYEETNVHFGNYIGHAGSITIAFEKVLFKI